MFILLSALLLISIHGNAFTGGATSAIEDNMMGKSDMIKKKEVCRDWKG